MTRRERIAFLLEHLEDVRAGVRERGSGGDHIPLMCRVWNHPSFQELERLVPLLRSEQPTLAWHLLEHSFAPRRWVSACPACGRSTHAWTSTNFHKHGRRNVALVPRVLRITPRSYSPRLSRRRSAGSTSAGTAKCSPGRAAAARGRGVNTPLGAANLRRLLEDASGEEAQLALSYIVWPGEAPDPRVVDEWLRRELRYLVTHAKTKNAHTRSAAMSAVPTVKSALNSRQTTATTYPHNQLSKSNPPFPGARDTRGGVGASIETVKTL